MAGWQAGAVISFLLLAGTPWLVHLLRSGRGRLAAAASAIPHLSTLRVALLLGYYLLFWTAFGGVFVLFINSVYPLTVQGALLAASGFALAFCLGFLVFVVPGGIGIRESALYLLLLPILPEPVCLLVAVGSRLWIMSGEVAALGLAVGFEKMKRDREFASGLNSD
jgi:hypothetical protein